jgi:uncharacterized membrane protein YedE/YeeE
MQFGIILLGFVFGAILQYARLNKYNVISGMAMLKDLTVAKAIAVAIGIGAILFAVEVGLGLASYHIKPILMGGIALGGIIFGIGMAILGYCPGTLAISLGEGSVDALLGIIGGLVAGFAYTLLVPYIQPVLGPDLGTISLSSLLGESKILFYVSTIVIAILFVAVAFWMNKKEGGNFKWLLAGIALALLNGIVNLTSVADHPIGASTAYPFTADYLLGATDNGYFAKIEKPGHWELLFLFGAFISGLVLSLLRKEFKLTLVHSNWQMFKGTSGLQRAIWSFAGGFILIIGARMAGGCTSGHVLSGGMQLSLSSMLFAVFVFAGLLSTGRLFYSKA